MPTDSTPSSGVAYSAESAYQGVTIIARLSTSSTFAGKADYFKGEPRSGCTPQSDAISSVGSWNTGISPNRYEMPELEFVFTASGVSVAYESVFLVIDGRATAPASYTSGAVNASANTITVAGHDLAEGEDIVLTEDTPGGFAGTGLTTGALYKAINVSASTFQPSLNGSSAVDITGSAAGWLHYAKGTVIAQRLMDSSQTILSGASATHRFTLYQESAD